MEQLATSYRLERLMQRYGELLTCGEVAQVLKYASAAAVRQAHSTGKLPVRLIRLPGRRPLYAEAIEIAQVIDAAAALDGDDQ